MGCDDGCRAEFQNILHRFRAGMRDVDDDTETVHLFHYFPTERAQSVMFRLTLGGIAYIIAAVVA